MRADPRLILLLAAAVGCSSEATGPSSTGGADAASASDVEAVDGPGSADAGVPMTDAISGADGGPDAGPDGGVGGPDILVSTVERELRFKRYDQLEQELARVLDLEPGTVCSELDRFRCTEVHRVALGGSKPYLANVFNRATEPTLTGPMAWERVAITACGEKVDRDRDAPLGSLFGPVLDGTALDPQGPAVQAVVQELYRRAFLREPTADEVEGWRDGVRTITDAGVDDPAVSWARILCSAVLSSREFVFY